MTDKQLNLTGNDLVVVISLVAQLVERLFYTGAELKMRQFWSDPSLNFSYYFD